MCDSESDSEKFRQHTKAALRFAAARRARGRQAGREHEERGWGERDRWRDIGCLFLLIA